MSESLQSILPLELRVACIEAGDRRVLNVSNLSVARGEFVCVVGPNGAGKSLLLQSLMGLLSNGVDVRWGGRKPSRLSYCKLGFVGQAPVLLRRSVAANVDFSLRAAGWSNTQKRKAAVDAALVDSQLAHLSQSPARLLSAGEQQRLALARVLACGPECIVLDEPSANMGQASTAWLESSLRAFHAQGSTVVMVTHDLHQARRLATRMLLVHEGELIADAPTVPFFEAPESEQARQFVAGELLL